METKTAGEKNRKIIRIMHRLIGIIVITTGIFLLFGCTNTKQELPQSKTSGPGLVQELENSILSLYDGPRKVWELKTDYMRKSIGNSSKMLAVPVVLTLFDSSGQTGTRVLADSGTTNASRDTFTVWGNVFVKTEDSLKVKAQRLCWSQSNHRVTTNTYVQIETKNGDIIRGKGLDANEDFSRWTIRERGREGFGLFPNFKERVEKEEEFL
ncbi:MAG: LPS export ABC transporter periplasmic protein LptC [Chitinivibrionales bacterium]|nr:LPS export ABC transporter periplasmic protein LptC [Chitinivibrionales bacterium]